MVNYMSMAIYGLALCVFYYFYLKLWSLKTSQFPLIFFFFFFFFFSVLCKLDDICLHLPSCCNSIILYSHEHLNEPQD